MEALKLLSPRQRQKFGDRRAGVNCLQSTSLLSPGVNTSFSRRKVTLESSKSAFRIMWPGEDSGRWVRVGLVKAVLGTAS